MPLVQLSPKHATRVRAARMIREFGFTLLLTMTAWALAFFLCRELHWKAFLHHPFTSEEFWVICLGSALGSAIFNHRDRARTTHHLRFARVDALCRRSMIP